MNWKHESEHLAEIARLERENARLREILGRMYNAPNNCPCEVSDEVLAIWKEAGDILSNASDHRF